MMVKPEVSFEDQVREVTHRYAEKLIKAHNAQKLETKSQLVHRRARKEVMEAQDEIRELQNSALAISVHTAYDDEA